ncbi:unnamed protein product [Mycena citricolor]|uniref:Uncharacterized protein n=1 Tax=Mycena citricolor TaxID=2018698 RepID=A0AAD2JXQ5_9AGAR|nr:unnamed protein product [Mycena citricolor]
MRQMREGMFSCNCPDFATLTEFCHRNYPNSLRQTHSRLAVAVSKMEHVKLAKTSCYLAPGAPRIDFSPIKGNVKTVSSR